jgi:flagellar protein FliT
MSAFMDQNALLKPLEMALSQSQLLLSLAQGGDWTSFEMLIQQRQQGLLSINDPEYLESLTEAQLDEKAVMLVKAIQSINEQLTTLAEEHASTAAAEIRHLTQAEKAMDAYGQ